VLKAAGGDALLQGQHATRGGLEKGGVIHID
jgi:hypothetical protein